MTFHPTKTIFVGNEPILGAGLGELLLSVGLPWPFQCTERDLEIQVPPGTSALVVHEPSDLFWGLFVKIHRESAESVVILLSNRATLQESVRALEKGVRGIISPKLPTEEIVSAIQQILDGACYFPSSAEKDERSPLVRFTKRENELVDLISQGLKNKEIATVMDLDEGTVKVYLSRVFGKAHVKDRYGLAVYSMQHGGQLLSAPQYGRSSLEL